MDKSNLELFKQALNEAVSNKFDKMADECTEEIVYSERHKLAMRTIVYGKTDNKRVWSPKMKRIIAILIAAALLLTSCGIIFRNEIREIFEEFFVKLTYDEDDESTESIKDVYYLGYVPEGYTLKRESATDVYIKYKFENQTGDFISFEQRAITSSDFYIDIEQGYSQINEIEKLDVYYRYTEKNHHYAWNDGKYSIKIKTNTKLSVDEIILLIDGIITK